MSLGTYGICIACKESIPEARLELSPDAATCVKCSGR